MKRERCISFYVLLSIIIGTAAGLALGIAFDRIATFTVGGAFVGLIIGLLSANDSRVTPTKTKKVSKKKQQKKLLRNK